MGINLGLVEVIFFPSGIAPDPRSVPDDRNIRYPIQHVLLAEPSVTCDI